MSLLTIQPSGKTIDVLAGTPLLQAILDAGEKLVSQCGGEAKCGACHIYIADGRKTVSKMTPLENGKLDEIIGVSSKSRLACQTLMGTEPVTIELLGAMSGF